MEQLLDDPETINFFQSNQVQLNTLKMQIDRRVDKIKLMINGGYNKYSSKKNHNDKTYVDTELQTQQDKEDYINHENPKRNYEKRRVLSTFNSQIFDPNNQNQCHKSRPSLTLNHQKKFDNRPSLQTNNHYNDKTKVSDYLSSKNTSLKNCVRFQNSSIKNIANEKVLCSPKNEQDIFLKVISYGEIDSFKNIEQIIEELKVKKKSFNHLNPKNDQLFSDSQGDNQETQINRKSFSIVGKRNASAVKKLRITERTTLTQAEKRVIIVSEECKQKILLQLSNNINKKRKQAGDNKLRANIIKKVQEKYQQFFQNI